MNREVRRFLPALALAVALLVALGAGPALAAIDGLVDLGPAAAFSLTAKTGMISTADGGSILIWGLSDGGGTVQYPGPTLIVEQGATVTVTLTNLLTVKNFAAPNVSLVFPGMDDVTATGGVGGLLAQEATPGNTVTNTVTYTFTATNPGTYTYYSGTEPDLQVEMGVLGAMIVRPTGYQVGGAGTYSAYGGGANNSSDDTDDTGYDREYLFLLTEMDPRIHQLVEYGLLDQVDTTTWWPVYWFLNGRTAPDTMDMAGMGTPWLPTQPYNCMPTAHPGDRVLLRFIGGGRDLHPYHTHGNHVRIVARDGALLNTPDAGAGIANASEMAFTTTVVPGGTVDAIYQWTGGSLGWDFYGHGWDIANGVSFYPGADRAAARAACIAAEPLTAGECPGGINDPACDHCRDFPVKLPNYLDLGRGPWYSGSPFLGTGGFLPPAEVGYNPYSGFAFMWHSHNENEIVNNNIFPGGMLTMVIIEHPSVLLPAE